MVIGIDGWEAGAKKPSLSITLPPVNILGPLPFFNKIFTCMEEK